MARRARSGLGSVAPAGLLPVAAIVVHELRYLLAYGRGTGAELAREGHAYLHSLTPWIVAATAAAAGLLLTALGRAFRGHRTPLRYSASLAGLWLACTTTLLGIYAGQETLEGLLSSGHPAGLAAILGGGGWWALPAAATVGLALAVVLHGARWAIAAIAARVADRIAVCRSRTANAYPPVLLAPAAHAPLAAGWSMRGPPPSL